jgi:hypothetical protein
MAKKIAVEGSTDRLKKPVALLLVRRAIAEWVVPGVMIRRLKGRARDVREVIDVRRPAYIPPGLPPAEVSDCRFQEPTSPTWREYHRSSVPPSQIGL